MTELVLHLPLPPPLSALTKNVDRVGRPKTKRYNAWISLAYFRAREQRPYPRFGKANVIADYQLGKPDRRRADVMNREKALSDMLVRLDVIEDDSQIVDLRMRWADVDGAVITIRAA